MIYASFYLIEFVLSHFWIGQAMWCNFIGWYQFGRITDLEHCIKRRSGVPDLPISFQLRSNLSTQIWIRLSKWKEGEGLADARFPVSSRQWGGHRGWCRGSWSWRRGGRGAAWHGEVEGVTKDLDYFLQRRGVVAVAVVVAVGFSGWRRAWFASR
jgi:hypothetical protein